MNRMMLLMRLRLPLFLLIVFMCILPFCVSAQAGGPNLACVISGPDSIFFDTLAFNQYVPDRFPIQVRIYNQGVVEADSVIAYPRSNQRFTIIPPATALVSSSLAPGDSASAVFSFIVNPREASGFDTIVVSVAGKNGARSDCRVVIWVEKEYRPRNVLTCPPAEDIRITFVDTLDSYQPDPIPVILTLTNAGDAPSKETKLYFVATPSVTLADGESPVVEIGQFESGARTQHTFRMRAVRRSTDTSVVLQFRCQGYGGLGDRRIDTLCSLPFTIPAVRTATFSLQCSNDVTIHYDSGRYSPNPFLWKVRVRNTGSAKAMHVRAVVTVPAVYALEPSTPLLQVLGDLSPGDTATMTWELRALPVTTADTSLICSRVFDQFNHLADCCDTLILPATRAPEIEAVCQVVPDTIHFNVLSGSYQPAEFPVRLQIVNTGSYPADSVRASLIITDPALAVVGGGSSEVLVANRMQPSDIQTVTWNLTSQPVNRARDVQFIIRVTAFNITPVVTACPVHIDSALVPELTCTTATMPEDTLHFNSATLIYDSLSLHARVRNMGSASATRVQATIMLPPNIGLPSGESAVKYLNAPLDIDSTWSVSWALDPLKRREGSLNEVGVEFRTLGSHPVLTTCTDNIFMVGIPYLTVFTIPSDAVDRYDRDVRVPVIIDEAQNKDIHTIHLEITYDDAVLRFSGYNRVSGLLDSTWSFTSADERGRLRFTAARPDSSLNGTGPLLSLDFRTVFGAGDDQLRISGSTLAFDSAVSSVNAGSILSRYYNGYITVSGDCLWPLKATDGIFIRNAPNPFNPTTQIEWRVPSAGLYRVEVLDNLGRVIRLLMQDWLEPKEYRVVFESAGLQGGVYYAVLTCASGRVMARMVVLK
jgi:hypothetical protein